MKISFLFKPLLHEGLTTAAPSFKVQAIIHWLKFKGFKIWQQNYENGMYIQPYLSSQGCIFFILSYYIILYYIIGLFLIQSAISLCKLQ